MAFGKVIVRTESGDYEEFELTRPTTSVGRQPGNDIVLNTSAVSRYHAQFDVAEGQVFLVDLGTVNGTFINDSQVEPDSRSPLTNGDVIIMGDVRLTFYAPEARVSVSLLPTAETIEKEGVPFRITLDNPNQPVAPSARLNLTLVIENIGTEENTYLIDVTGMDPGWAKSSWKEITLDTEQSTQVQISVRPPRATNTRPGRYPLTVRVSLQTDPDSFLEVLREIDIVPYSALAMNVADLGSRGSYRVDLQNQGNSRLDLILDGFDRGHLLQYAFTPSRLELEPGEVSHIALTVRPAPYVDVISHPVSFAVVAETNDIAHFKVPLSTRYAQNSQEGSFLMASIGLGVPLLIALGIGILTLVFGTLIVLDVIRLPFGAAATAMPPAMTPTTIVVTPSVAALPPTAPPPAQIDRFEAQPVKVVYRTQGEIALSWDVTGAVEVRLLDDDDNPIGLDADDKSTRRYAIQIQSLEPGDYVYRLEVVGADNTAEYQEVKFSVVVEECVLRQTPNILLLLSPLDPTGLAPGLLDPAARVVTIAGRSDDGQWLKIEYNENVDQAWAQIGDVICEGSPSFEDYIVVDPSEGLQ